MLQLIGVHRSRGASGGGRISSLLNGGEIYTQSKFLGGLHLIGKVIYSNEAQWQLASQICHLV